MNSPQKITNHQMSRNDTAFYPLTDSISTPKLTVKNVATEKKETIEKNKNIYFFFEKQIRPNWTVNDNAY